MLNFIREYRERNRRRAELSDRFTVVHDKNLWGSEESRSGAGSARNSPSVAIAASAIKKAIEENRIRSLGDIPCGDFNWMPDVLSSIGDLTYIGFDIVFSALQLNKSRFPQYEFRVLDITTTVPPQVDLIFCKDLLNHLKYEDVVSAISNMKKSGSKFLLASNNAGHVNVQLPDDLPGSRFQRTALDFGKLHEPLAFTGLG
jgi:trans-aconitate methyltransferase